MNRIWCVFEYDSEGSCEFPQLFDSRKEAGIYINNSAIDEYNEIEKYSDSAIEVDCNTNLYAHVGTDKSSLIWRGFEITDELLSIFLKNYMKAKENNNV